jgi:hypothetical protein
MRTQFITDRHWIVLLLALFSFVMSALLSRIVFERLPHLEDEMAYLFQARILARGDLVAPAPALSQALWQPFVIQHEGHRFGKYPLGWPAQLAVGELLGASWLVNASLAALTVTMVYRMGSSIFSRDTGLIAAALTSVSPMTLLLSATLMGHTSALFFFSLFIYTYWRMENRGHKLLWGAVAGLALGMVIANRPLSGLAVALPLVAWSVIQVVRTQFQGKRTRLIDLTRLLISLRPLVVLTVCALFLSATIPFFSAAAVGDATANLYTRVWSYDRVGFGECCGRSGHTLAKAFNHLHFDLSLAAADLFGWQIGGWDDELVRHLRQESDLFPNLGVSWLLLPFGLWIGFQQRRAALLLWLLLGAVWVWFGASGSPERFVSPTNAWLWIGTALVWAIAPLIWLSASRYTSQTQWVWILVAVAICVCVTHMTYWVGSQRYSTRYYFEALLTLAVLSALPVAWLAQHIGRSQVYLLLAIVILLSLATYTLPRIQVLYAFNNVSQVWIDQARARRADTRPMLVIMTGTDLSWRSMGSFMAATSPYLDSDIIGAFNQVRSAADEGLRAQLIALFPDRQVIELRGRGAQAAFLQAAASGSGD